MNANRFAQRLVHLHQLAATTPASSPAAATPAWSASTSASRCRSPIFPFTGHKDSFFGDLHAMGKDGVAFFTETKAVTATWFTDEHRHQKVGTWDGMSTRS